MFSITTAARHARELDPLFDALRREDKLATAREAIAELGGDPADAEIVAAVITHRQPESPRPQPAPLTARFKVALGLNDGETADLLGVSRPTVNLWKNGKIPEYLPADRRRLMASALRERRDIITELLDLLQAQGGA